MSVIPEANNAFKPCVVIPCFNHGAMIASVLAGVKLFGLPCFIVDDGSDAATQEILRSVTAHDPDITLLRLPENQGKGAAVIHGLEAAEAAGFSHAVQVDADGQHQISDISRLLTQAEKYPYKLISGQPVYDDSIPKSRLYGRYITHFWVWLETLSFSLKDTMCGFRVYPVKPTLDLCRKIAIGKRMDFDIEIMVRLYWAGTASDFIPTKVIYPENGVSHFDVLRDNLRISYMHTKLFLSMLPRIPLLLRQRKTQTQHWAAVQERKGLSGMRFMLFIYRLFGKGAFTLLLWPVAGYFWLTGVQQRKASSAYLQKIIRLANSRNIVLPGKLTTFHHFLRFGHAMLDKLASWQGDIKWGKDIGFVPGAESELHKDIGRGVLILASHLGDIEVCRALAQQDARLKINALVFSDHAQRFKQLLEQVNDQAGVNLIPVNDIGPDTAILLKQKLDAGEWVAIVGDRTPVSEKQRGGNRRVLWSSFLGEPAPFPQGPFLLAAALQCPVKLMFALREQDQLRIYCEHFAEQIPFPRHARQQVLQSLADRYAARLEHYALRSPLDWFNFFDFWALPDEPVPVRSEN